MNVYVTMNRLVTRTIRTHSEIWTPERANRDSHPDNAAEQVGPDVARLIVQVANSRGARAQ